MRNPKGYISIVEPGKATIERDTFTCGHCNRIVIGKIGEAPEQTGGMCKQCMSLVCPGCVEDGKCTPLEKRLEESERRGEFLKSVLG